MSISQLGQNLIFIISQPRAGSTLLQRLLAGHPSIHTTAEPWLMLHPLYALRESGHTAEYNATLAYTALRDFQNTLEGKEENYYAALRLMAVHLYNVACQQAGKTHFLDKTPRYYNIIPELAHLFPEAKFIILFRNPLSVLASVLNTLVEGHWLLLARYKSDLLDAPGLLIGGLQKLGGRSLRISYEDLVYNTDRNLKAACEFLEIDFRLEMLEYGKHAAPEGRMGDPINIYKYTSVSSHGLDRWLHLGEHQQTRHLAQSYLEYLGSLRLSAMMYDYAELENKLADIPCTSGKIEVTWDELFNPSIALQKRLYLLELALLEHRRIVYAIRRFFTSRRARS